MKILYIIVSPNAGKCGPKKLRIRTLFTKCNCVIFRYDIYLFLTLLNSSYSILSWGRYLLNNSLMCLSRCLTISFLKLDSDSLTDDFSWLVCCAFSFG